MTCVEFSCLKTVGLTPAFASFEAGFLGADFFFGAAFLTGREVVLVTFVSFVVLVVFVIFFLVVVRVISVLPQFCVSPFFKSQEGSAEELPRPLFFSPL